MNEPRDPAQRKGDKGGRGGQFDRIQSDARIRLSFERTEPSNLWIQSEVLGRGQTIEAQHQKIEIERETVVVFADDAPLANWGHPCRYLLYEPENGELYRTVEADFPPYLVDPPETFEPFHLPIKWYEPELLWPIYLPWWKWRWKFPGDGYAILFSGASNNRHTNDLEFLYRVLVNDYGWDEDKIYVLNYNGTIDYSGSPHPVVSWPGNSTAYQMTVNGSGTKSEFENVIDELKGRIQPQDRLVIHTNNHGGRDSDSYLCTYSGPNYYPDDFSAKVGELPNFSCLIVMMEQCYAGGFNQRIINNSPANSTSVASAAIATQTSIGGPSFDPFARDWIAAMHKANPDGSALSSNPDTSGDGRVSAKEAYNYANLVHDPWDTPNYSQSSSAAGSCRLGASWFIWPIIYLYLERWWRRPWPEAIERLEPIQPELTKLLGAELQRRDKVEHEVGELVKKALGVEAEAD
jgi:Peptidase C13 family